MVEKALEQLTLSEDQPMQDETPAPIAEEQKEQAPPKIPQTKDELLQKAVELKEAGNVYFKAKDYKKALSKYSVIRMYVRSILPPDDKEAASYTQGVGVPATEKQQQEAKELAAITFLNMSICFFLLGDYMKAVEKATESLKYKKTVKALYRRGKAYQKRQDFERAIQDMTEAIKMDTSDVNDIGQELVQLRLQQKEQTKKANAKMAGFLLRDEE